MNRTILTPCRQVGLSRKKGTPKVIENILNKSTNISTPIRDSNNSNTRKTQNTSFKEILKDDPNHETPCRQVGLSRKKKSTPLNKHERQTPTNKPSLLNITPRIDLPKKQLLVDENGERNSTLKVDNDEVSKNILKGSINSKTVIPIKIIQKEIRTPTSTPTLSKNTPRKDLPEGQLLLEGNNEEIVPLERSRVDDEASKTILKEVHLSNNKPVLSRIIHDNGETKNKSSSNESKELNSFTKIDHIKSDDTLESDSEMKPNTSFIKISYTDKKENITNASNDESQNETRKNEKINSQKPKFSRKIFDDDDFEISPRKIKLKKIERCDTDIHIKSSKEKSRRNKKVIKKSLTDASISSYEFSPDCFVKLEQIKTKNMKSSTTFAKSETFHELSDDDFECSILTPPENIRTTLNKLEAEITQKKTILDELNRAKLSKKLHDVDKLRNLTAQWRNGFERAINDLLIKVNSHTQINMQNLLKRLNLPQDCISLSQ